MIDRSTLERQQVWVYLGAIALGLLAGKAGTAVTKLFDALLWPTLALLLFVTFLQVPLLQLREAYRSYHFVAAVVVGNFMVLPGVAWFLLQWLPPDPAIRLGVLLVLLVPCTDWFITFCQLGGGDTARAVAITPLNLMLQLALLPVYIWLMLDGGHTAVFRAEVLWPAFIVILVPLVGAAATEYWAKATPARRALTEPLAWWPVPLLAVVLFLIAGAHVDVVTDELDVLLLVTPFFVIFLFIAAGLAKIIASLAALPKEQGRTLAFSLGTRNSFLVLPVALSLPAGWESAAIVIVAQSLIELFGMVFFVWWIPKRLFR